AVKTVPPGALLTVGFSGVVSPWLLEPHVDPAFPPAALTVVALHELAHTAGFAREAEAEAVALLAGLGCDDPAAAYAAAVRAAAGGGAGGIRSGVARGRPRGPEGGGGRRRALPLRRPGARGGARLRRLPRQPGHRWRHGRLRQGDGRPRQAAPARPGAGVTWRRGRPALTRPLATARGCA